MRVIQIALATLWIQTAAVPTQPASISGTVVEAGTGKPIANAQLQLRIHPSPNSTTTDSDGKFELANLQPGSYSQLSVLASGYVSGVYSGLGSSTEIKLESGQKITNVHIELIPTGTISGRILDADGNPLPNAAVQALQINYSNGRKSWRVVESRPTNDLGEYRLFWLKPGQYYLRTVQDESVETSVSSDFRSVGLNEYLSVRPPALIRKISDDGITEDGAMFPVYFPGTSDPKLAAPIALRAGATFGGADIRTTPVAVHRIRGRIEGASFAMDATAVARLIPLDSASSPNYLAMDGSDLKGSIDSNNRFEISGIPPGNYELTASVYSKSMRWSGKLSVEVQDKDVDDLLVPMAPNIRITGRFLDEGNSGNNSSLQVSAEYLLRSELADETTIEGIVDGTTLTFDNVPPGKYQIEAANLIARLSGRDLFHSAYMESIRAGDQNVLRDGLRVEGAIRETIAIVLRTDFGRLSGRILGGPSQSVRGISIVLVPDIRTQPDRYKVVRTDVSGKFYIENIAPGGYRIFAWESIEDGSWQNAEFLAANESRGRAVQIKAGDNEAIDIPVLAAGQ